MKSLKFIAEVNEEWGKIILIILGHKKVSMIRQDVPPLCYLVRLRQMAALLPELLFVLLL